MRIITEVCGFSKALCGFIDACADYRQLLRIIFISFSRKSIKPKSKSLEFQRFSISQLLKYAIFIRTDIKKSARGLNNPQRHQVIRRDNSKSALRLKNPHNRRNNPQGIQEIRMAPDKSARAMNNPQNSTKINTKNYYRIAGRSAEKLRR